MFKKLNDKGQVALFVALIFQVLFVFFAMIINVGLLVHHKINLQNSVDIAAYYGAMKQAEMLNAIGHINYQIRQSWKLMSFRYGQLGTAGAINQHPFDPGFTGDPGQVRAGRDQDIAWPKEPVFCIPYTPFSIVNQTESYCKDAGGVTVLLPGIPTLGPASIFVNFQTAIAGAATAFRNSAISGCQNSMALNWLQIAQFIQAYKVDIRNRKKLLLALANEMSSRDPNDIEGQPIRKGVFKTLYKNLTYQNQESLRSRYNENGDGSDGTEAKFQFINSFGEGDCGGRGNEVAPPGWLSEVFIFPYYAYVDATCTGSTTAIDFKAEYLNTGSTAPISQNALLKFKLEANAVLPYIQEAGTSDPTQLLYRTSMGFEKNPWCVGYVGVSASTTPKIPFTPLGAVTMKATAFAKPFGGRVGPWYNSKWNPSADKSDESAPLTDKVLPIRVDASQMIGNADPQSIVKAYRAYPNHSRYMGDEVGVRSELTMGQFARAIHKRGSIDLNSYSLSISNEIASEFDQKGQNGDILPWDPIGNKPVPMRETEIAAIVPDQFDVANYSIDPDFYNNYLKRIEKGYGSKYSFLFRGDLGSRMNGSDQEKRFSIRNQLDTLKGPTAQFVDAQSKLSYYINEFAQVLTSWQQKSPDEYIIDDSRFGKCLQDSEVKQDDDEKFYTSGSCKIGGRTGYSVKLVDGKFLQNQVNGQSKDYELGGKGVSGRIKNPPPAGF